VLITGGSGFIGTNLVEYYLRNGSVTVTSLDLEPPRNTDHEGQWIQHDLRDAVATERVVTDFNPTHVFHLAARTDLRGSTIADYSSNTDGTRSLLRALRQLKTAPNVVVASTRLVCHPGYTPVSDTDFRPTTAYGASKAEMEQIFRAEATHDWIIVRPTSVWGPWFREPYRDFFDLVQAGRYLHPAGHTVLKSMGFVGNAVFQLDRLIGHGFPVLNRRVLYLADYEATNIEEWARHIAAITGSQPPKRVPVPLLRLAAVVGDASRALGVRNPPLTTFRLRNILTSQVFDTGPLQDVVGPLPFTRDEGDEITVDWLSDTTRGVGKAP